MVYILGGRSPGTTEAPEASAHSSDTIRRARIGVVVLSNASTLSGVDDIGFHLLNPKLPLANPEPPKQHTEIHIDPKLLDNYTGRYQLTPNLIFEITRDGDRLFAQGFAQVTGQAIALPKFELFAEGEKNFFARVADSQITFETGPEGRATSLILHRAGRDPCPPPDCPDSRLHSVCQETMKYEIVCLAAPSRFDGIAGHSRNGVGFADPG